MQSSNRNLRFEALESRRLLAVTLQDFQDAGISTRASDTLLQSQYASTIVEDSTLENALRAISETKVAPLNATVITSVAGLSQIVAGTTTSPNIYLIQGDLTITSNIEVPSNVHIYVDGSIYKAGSHTRTPGSPSENEADYIFRVSNAQNVRLIGVDNAYLHSRQTLNDQQGHATAVYVTGSSTNNVTVEGFEIGWVWEGLVARGGPKNVVFANNYIHDTLKRAIWHLTSQDSIAVHNFIENAGFDGMDWDAFVDRSVGYENVVVGAGRWLGFVEEAAQDSAFIRNFGYMVDYGNPNANIVYQLGWVDHGTTFNTGNQTENNYFIDNVVFRPTGFNEGGPYYANQPPKGDTWFWANRGYANGGGLDVNYYTTLIEAEWLTFIPDRDILFLTGVPTVAAPGETITAAEWLQRLDDLYNALPRIELVAAPLSVSELAAPGTGIGVVTPLDGDPAELSFSIAGGNVGGAFAIDNNGVITVAGPLDRMTQPAYGLEIEATDGVRTGSVLVGISVKAAVGQELTLFDHEFNSPGFVAGNVVGQQGWTAQTGWNVTDPAGQGELVSSTTAYQGVTNTAGANLEVGDAVRIELDVRIDIGAGGAGDLFRYGVTTLDAGGSFVPSLQNSGSSAMSSRIAYNGNGATVLKVWPDTTTTASQVELTAAAIGVDFGAGDRLTDELRFTWVAEKSATPGVWEVEMVITNVDTGVELGRNTIPITEATVYNTTTGLFAGVRGLQNSSGSTFRVDRFSYEAITPTAPLPGDYNDDGFVDAADYTVWRDSLNQAGANLPADFNRSGVVDTVDYITWRVNYGLERPPAVSAAVTRTNGVVEALEQPESSAELAFVWSPDSVSPDSVSPVPDEGGDAPAVAEPVATLDPRETALLLLYSLNSDDTDLEDEPTDSAVSANDENNESPASSVGVALLDEI